jgi:glycine cleavage system H protein
MVEYPSDLKYTREHEWAVLEENNRVRVGISDFAQDALGDVVYVNLPDEGTEVRAGEAMGEVESTKSVSDIFSPVSGRIVERNQALTDSPELVNQEPYGEGWMVLIEMSDPEELDDLLDADAYRRHAESGGDEA